MQDKMYMVSLIWKHHHIICITAAEGQHILWCIEEGKKPFPEIKR